VPIDYAASGRFSAPEEGLPFGGKSSLQIISVQEEDFGLYNCTVVNSKGSATLMITLEKSGELLTFEHLIQMFCLCVMNLKTILSQHGTEYIEWIGTEWNRMDKNE